MPRRSRPAGRPGALDEARALVALVASLSEAGDALTPEAVSSRLGVDAEQAEKLIGLVLTAAGADGEQLPLTEEGGGVTLALSRGVRGRRLRLTRGETLALLAALERLGVPEADPLRSRLAGSLQGGAPDEGGVRRLLGSSDGRDGAVVAACAEALAGHRDLEFAYHKEPGGEAEERHVRPLRLRSEGDAWYLEAHDLDRRAERTFRADRMGDVRAVARAAAGAEEGRPAAHAGAREVRLVFHEPRYLDLLPWHELSVTRRDAEANVVEATTPLYGGTWLARMVAACGGTVTTDDPELAALVADYARAQLDARG